MVKNLSTVERSTKIRFGKNCTDDQADNTIVFNASEEEINADRQGSVYMTPLRQLLDNNQTFLAYDRESKEILDSGLTKRQAFGVPTLDEVVATGNVTSNGITVGSIIAFEDSSFNANLTISHKTTTNDMTVLSLQSNVIPLVDSNNTFINSKISQPSETLVNVESGMNVYGNVIVSGDTTATNVIVDGFLEKLKVPMPFQHLI